ncbi:MAG: DUF615 domain-containing protein [Alphaproteobacteria bacterium]|nr:DUF615 domain-containing protein [Alphaproteobacteria bacterium]MCB9696561.1 DUF615 domain-containing protein [Alphaproteobacteria bacterium]
MQDEDHDDGLGGRSRDRREFTENNQRWAARLLELSEVDLVHPSVPEVVREELVVARNATSYRARNRSVRRVDMLVSLMADEEIEVLEAFLDAPRASVHPQIAAWLKRLRDDGSAVTELLEQHPDLEVQRLRQLARNLGKPALREKARAGLIEMLAVVVLRSDT